MATTTTTTTTGPKSGIKTTEFWVGVLSAPLVTILAGLLANFGINVSDATIATLVTPFLAYIGARGWTKAADSKATAIAAATVALPDAPQL